MLGRRWRCLSFVLCFLFVATVTAKAGGSLSFSDGSYVRVEDSATLDITDQITMEAWVYKTYNGEDFNIIFSKPWDWDDNPWHVYRMGLQPGGNVPKTATFSLGLSGGIVGVATASTIPDNTWVHIACTYDGSALKIYLNGILEGTVAASGPIRTNDQPVVIGRNLLNTWNDWFGRVDEVRLWNVARTYEQIRDDMCHGLTGSEPGLVGYWKFDEGSGGTAADSSGHGNTGTLMGGPVWDVGKADCPPCTPPPSGLVSWWGGDQNPLDLVGANHGTLAGGAGYASGEVGQAFTLDGSLAYVQLPASATLRPSLITVDAWINLASSTDAIIFDNASASPYYGYEFWLGSGNRLHADVYASGHVALAGNTALQTGTWYHVAMTYDGSNLKLYVNGAEDGSTSVTGPINYSVQVVPTIGKRAVYSSYYFPGLIDEVEIFNRGLSAPEVAAIYNAGSGGKCRPCPASAPNPVSWWKAEYTTKDYSGGNNGILENGAYYDYGEAGSAFRLDGVDDYVLIGDPVPSSLQIQNEITLEAWIYAFQYPGGSTLGTILGSQYDTTGSGATFFLDGRTNPDGHSGVPAGHIHFNIGDGSWHASNTQSQVPLDQWVHVVAARKANESARIYFNGALQPSMSNPWTGGITYNGAWFAVGQQKDVNRPFLGLIDEPAVYDRALTADQVAALYNARGTGRCNANPLPRSIPDGTTSTTPLMAAKLVSDGSALSLTWDGECSPFKTDVLYGRLGDLPSYALLGSKCDITNPDTWVASESDLWFILVSDDGLGTESSWGSATSGPRNGTAVSGCCGNTARDNSGACP